jgi:Domain of unknown function (DUF4287)
MTYKAYLDNIQAKTGKSADDFLAMATKKGFVKDGKVVVKHSELLKWLKSDIGLGHGHAMAIIMYIKDPEFVKRKIAGEMEMAKRR